MAGREFSGHLSQLFLLPPLAVHHLGASQLTVAHLIAMAKNSSYSKRKTRWQSKRNHIGESQLKYCATFVIRIWMACNLMLWCLDRYLWVRDPLHQAKRWLLGFTHMEGSKCCTFTWRQAKGAAKMAHHTADCLQRAHFACNFGVGFVFGCYKTTAHTTGVRRVETQRSKSTK
jgi:hypothetical protein